MDSEVAPTFTRLHVKLVGILYGNDRTVPAQTMKAPRGGKQLV